PIWSPFCFRYPGGSIRYAEPTLSAWFPDSHADDSVSSQQCMARGCKLNRIRDVGSKSRSPARRPGPDLQHFQVSAIYARKFSAVIGEVGSKRVERIDRLPN